MSPFWEVEGFWGYLAGLLGSGGVLWKAIDAYRTWKTGKVAAAEAEIQETAETEEREYNRLRELLVTAQDAQAEAEEAERRAYRDRDREARHRRRVEETLAITRQLWVAKGHPIAELDLTAPWPARTTNDNGNTK